MIQSKILIRAMMKICLSWLSSAEDVEIYEMMVQGCVSLTADLVLYEHEWTHNLQNRAVKLLDPDLEVRNKHAKTMDQRLI